MCDSGAPRLLEGRTGDSGEFSFPVPAITDLNIVLTAGMGHRNSWTLSAAELGGTAPGTVPAAPGTPAAPDSEMRREAVPAGNGLTAREVEDIMARQLEQKIRPLNRTLATMQDRGPTLSDIIGGIGHILGLEGLGAHPRSRHDKQP